MKNPLKLLHLLPPLLLLLLSGGLELRTGARTAVAWLSFSVMKPSFHFWWLRWDATVSPLNTPFCLSVCLLALLVIFCFCFCFLVPGTEPRAFGLN